MTNTALVLVLSGLWAIVALLPAGSVAAGTLTVAVFLAPTAAAVRGRAPDALPLGLFCTSAAAFLQFAPIAPWPIPILAALAAYGALVRLTGTGQAALGWLRAGSFDAGTRWLVAATAVVSGIALLVWHRLAGADVAEFRALVPVLPLWAYPLAALLFATANAAAEEAAYRGILMHALLGVLGSGMWTILIQAVAFGIMHIRGFPQGVSGIILATIYGLMLGAIRQRSGGMLAPWLAHVAADLVIFAIVAAISS